MRNIPHKVTGDDLTADEFDDIPEEEENLITSTGQTLTAADLYQIAKAVSIYVAVGDFYGCTNTGNDYVLTAISPLQAPIQYNDGFRCRFRISYTNTGASTINVNGLGIKTIVKEDGLTPLGPGDLPIGEHGELIYHADIDAFELYSHKYQDNVFVTGDNIWSDRTDERAGFLLINNSTKTTIGDASSLATLRANADCEQLFLLYWNTKRDEECPVVSGRGASAAADWSAHKKITIPDSLLRVFAVWNYASVYSGSIEGTRDQGLAETHNGPHAHSIGVGIDHETNDLGGSGWLAAPGTFYTNVSGLGTPHNNIQPTIYKTLYIKL